METLDFFLPSPVPGNDVGCTAWLPDSEPVATLQIAHGMTEHTHLYDGLASYMASNGIAVYASDHPGHGRSNWGTKGFFAEENGDDLLIECVHILSEEIEEHHPRLPHFILGFSLGSFVVRRVMTRYGNEYDGFILGGSGNTRKWEISASLFLVRRTIRKEGPKSYCPKIEKLMFGKFNKKFDKSAGHMAWLSNDPDLLVSYLKDPKCKVRFTSSAYRDMFTLIKDLVDRKDFDRIPKDTKAVFISGKDDPLGDFGKGVVKASDDLSKLGIESEYWFYDGMRHAVFFGKGSEKVNERVLGWIKDRC